MVANFDQANAGIAMSWVRRRLTSVVVIAFGVLLGLGSIWYTTGRSGHPDGDPLGFKVWQLLVALQFFVWAALAVVNLFLLNRMDAHVPADSNAGLFLLAVYGLLVLILAPAQMMNVIATEGSELGLAGTLLQVFGALAVAPALISLQRIRSAADSDEVWDTSASSLQLMRFLRRSIKPAVASIGVVIGLAILATGQIRSVGGAVPPVDEPPLVLLYGSLFTGVLFAAYIYSLSGLDGRCRIIINQIVDPGDPVDYQEFSQREEHRRLLGEALGMGRSAKEQFEGLVAVATPLLGGLVAFYL